MAKDLTIAVRCSGCSLKWVWKGDYFYKVVDESVGCDDEVRVPSGEVSMICDCQTLIGAYDPNKNILTINDWHNQEKS